MIRTQQITLDVYEAPYFVYVNAKQRDNDSRVLVVTLTDQGKEIKPDHTSDTAVFRARKPDGTCVLDPATIGEDGKITVALSDQTLAVPGDVEADIAVVNGDDILSTASFYIQVARAPLGQGIVSENEFLVMVEATAKAEEAAKAANTAAGLIEGMTVSASKVAAGGSPTAELTKKDGHYELDLGLVTGDKGAKGDAATVQIGTVTTGEPGSSASVKNSGTETDAKLDFVIPQGPVGPAGPVSSVNGGTGDVDTRDLQFDISLPASGWVNGQQTVKDARFADGDYDWDVDVKGACIPWDGITITEGQMMAKADITPATDMTWTVTRREVRRDG